MDSWEDLLDDLPVEMRIKARLSYELASDRVHGESFEMTSNALKAVAEAEGLDCSHPWIEAAARKISEEALSTDERLRPRPDR